MSGQPALAAADRLRGAAARWWLPLLLFCLLALAPLAADLTGRGYYVNLLTRVMILALAAMALDFVLGVGGMVSLGHAAFVGVGAYTVGIMAEHGLTSGFLQWPAALLLSAMLAAGIGALSVRTRGVQFIMITLAFAQMLYFAATSLARYGGDDGLTVWQRSEFVASLDLADRMTFYYVTLAVLLASYLGLRRIVASRFGRVLRGCALDERRLQAMGVAPTRYKLVAFVISGALTGLAGVLLANHTEFVAPAYMAWIRSGELIVMVVLGGLGTLHGAILGALVFLLLEDLLADITQHWQVVLGPIVILVVLFARGGLVRLGTSWPTR